MHEYFSISFNNDMPPTKLQNLEPQEIFIKGAVKGFCVGLKEAYFLMEDGSVEMVK